MKKGIFLIILTVTLGNFIFGQDDELQQNGTVHMIVDDIQQANKELNKIIDTYVITVNSSDIDNTSKQSRYELFSNEENFDLTIQAIEQLGITDLKIIESNNFKDSIDDIHFELDYLQSQKEVYSSELPKQNNNANNYKDLFDKEREIDKEIYEKQKSIRSMTDKVGVSVIQVQLAEKSIQDLTSDNAFGNFINMPGAETNFFHLENSSEDLVTDYYGGSLRYMFTKGRAYLVIGVLKPYEKKSGDNVINDIVTYCYGKDFYPRYLGRGQRTFFNPFSGFEIGGMIFTSDEDIEHIFTFEPHVGLELFKNRFIIADVRVGYLFPLDQDYIKSRRGFTQNMSLNFVF
ncbi:hypothetical protein [Spirochaeta cellobiosiphila]|uniref:hypothetical protein n=1 Tax=Spirochaeta cellobiosiphila TaxID=504483 RepID=UPI00041DC008|nr:hypothetical protein [Spirochaeta cellobiosiphila]